MTAINNTHPKKFNKRAKIDRRAQLLFSWVESKDFLHLAQTINRCGESVRLRVMRWETNLSTDAAVCDRAEIDSCFLLVFKRIRYDFYFPKIFPDRLPFAESIPFHVSFVVWR